MQTRQEAAQRRQCLRLVVDEQLRWELHQVGPGAAVQVQALLAAGAGGQRDAAGQVGVAEDHEAKAPLIGQAASRAQVGGLGLAQAVKLLAVLEHAQRPLQGGQPVFQVVHLGGDEELQHAQHLAEATTPARRGDDVTKVVRRGGDVTKVVRRGGDVATVARRGRCQIELAQEQGGLAARQDLRQHLLQGRVPIAGAALPGQARAPVGGAGTRGDLPAEGG